jgi:hypothetical protein
VVTCRPHLPSAYSFLWCVLQRPTQSSDRIDEHAGGHGSNAGGMNTMLNSSQYPHESTGRGSLYGQSPDKTPTVTFSDLDRFLSVQQFLFIHSPYATGSKDGIPATFLAKSFLAHLSTHFFQLSTSSPSRILYLLWIRSTSLSIPTSNSKTITDPPLIRSSTLTPASPFRKPRSAL